MSLRERLLEQEVRDLGDDVYEWFLGMVAAGESVPFAHMCVFRECGTMRNSDKAFNEGQRRKMYRMTDLNRDNMVRIARKAGISTEGKYYVGGLGRYNDPHAWVSTAEDVLEVCKKKNLTARGVVNYQSAEQPPPPRKRLADHIVARKVKEELSKSPRAREAYRKSPQKAVAELQEKVVAKHGRQD